MDIEKEIFSVFGKRLIKRGKKEEPKDFVCDNTDCKGKNQKKIFRVVLRQEFGSTTCNWCVDCIKRDNDIIHTILNEKEK